MFTALKGGHKFSKLDLKEVYLQMTLDEESRKYVVINTHQGLYQFTRVPYGISSAPTLFQKTMDTLLQGKKGVVCNIDDILVTGQNEDDHLRNLSKVFKTLKKEGIKLKKEKCKFLQEEVKFLGYKINAQGIPYKSRRNRKSPQTRESTTIKIFFGVNTVLWEIYVKFIYLITSVTSAISSKFKMEMDAGMRKLSK